MSVFRKALTLLRTPPPPSTAGSLTLTRTCWSGQPDSSRPPATSAFSENSVLQHRDFFGVHDLFTVKDLFDARVHLGHKHVETQMRPFIYGTRFGVHIIDLDETALLLRQALNFLAHIAYRNGIILFVARQVLHGVLLLR